MDRLTNGQRNLAAQWVRWAYKLAGQRGLPSNGVPSQYDTDDLTGSAMLALCHAARCHRPNAAAFSNYARTAILRALDAEQCRQASNGLGGLRRARLAGRVRGAGAVGQLGDEAAWPESQEPHPRAAELWNAVDNLPRSVRRAVLLRFAGGLSFSDIGRTLRITDKLAKYRVNRGVTLLRQRLG